MYAPSFAFRCRGRRAPFLVETQLRAAEAERDTADAQDPSVEPKRDNAHSIAQQIGPASAAILTRQIFGRPFANRRQVASYLGLTPSAYDSGSTTRCQGISKAGNGFARRFMIECCRMKRIIPEIKTALFQLYRDLQS
jgi:transposase